MPLTPYYDHAGIAGRQKANEKARRHRARKAGQDIPKRKPGPPKGSKQTQEHIEKRKRFGPNHHAWLGGQVSVRGGRTRAKRVHPKIGPCRRCGAVKSERHHKNGNTADNRPENIEPCVENAIWKRMVV